MSDNSKVTIQIIAEGFEEKPYLDKLLEFPNINKIYKFLPVINVKGNGSIVPRYQYLYQQGNSDLILIFCDADKGSEQFFLMVQQIGEQFFENREDALSVFIFSNPVTLQIVLSHFGNVALASGSKKTNASIVEQLTGIKDYDAKDEQIKEMIGKIHYRTLEVAKNNLKCISRNICDVPSTNFLTFLERFENDDMSWVDDIKNKLKK